MKITEPFKKLPQGFYRLVMVGWLVLPILIAAIAEGAQSHSDGTAFWATFIFGIPIYYALARFTIWIYDGFKNP